MKHLILGTAGHIDHGKTSLVKALTGTDTDRLKEEKARGITIELGFAHLELPGGIEFGVVDVPGHEKFVRAMVAGVAGMDLVMLVIAADEGIMPQTREHLDILRLLGVHTGLVALTKQDMVEPDWLPLVQEEVREFVAGTFLESAPIIPVSSRTGAGLEELKAELVRLAEGAAEKKRDGAFRLPVDRVFTVAGFGTVVTGTLLAGEIRVGDELELLPGRIPGRVRGIQAHGARTEVGQAGQRLAVNLQGIDLDQAHRGDVVVPAGVFRTSRRVDVRLDHLASAPRDLRHRSTVRFHSGTSEVTAQIILLEHDALPPGQSGYAQLRLDQPLLLVSGDPYLIRASSPSVTIGGGIVLDPFPPARRRRSDDALRLLVSLDAAEHQKTCNLIVSQALLSGVSFDEIVLRSGIARKQAETALQGLLTAGEIVQMTREPRVFLAKAAVAGLKQLLVDELSGYLAANPLKEGISKEELKTRIPKRSDQRFFAPLLAELEKEGKLAAERELVRPAGVRKQAAAPSSGLGASIARLLAERGIEPPTIKELAEALRSTEKEVRDHLALLTREGGVTRVSGDIFYDSALLKTIEEKLISHLRAKAEIIPSEFRELTGLSRKFMIPLLEYFDSRKVTIRIGDKRVLRGR
ncbi:selenocysteine-specific translation elongation factor [Trichlorobacter lovleyi]|uniref:selenocysteine-specific translation elongation factor n=1 Tax=Trichlorobacter lovleyi TaxID=313985 RepID=UPI00223FB7AB|nr:selenocysteine-specific translation elongation factor [Trichlorobacter lovleyi]QOX80525.1 selenocysteine-specific translation elongation factor [Trichlorobacter lovleyi]